MNSSLERLAANDLTADVNEAFPGEYEEMRRNFNAKRRIAEMAASLITDNQSVVFDSGSTLLQLAIQMPPVTNVVLATTAMKSKK